MGRFQRSFADNFGEFSVVHTASRGWRDKHADMHQIEVQASPPDDCGHLIGIYDATLPKRERDGLASIKSVPGQRRWRFNLTRSYFRARMEPVDFEDYRSLYPGLEAHAFNRLAAQGTDQFLYFPYGYLFRILGAGPLNEFGHRIREPLDGLADRPDHEKVILWFGGSAAWSMDCLYSEMLTHQLEQRLNSHAQRVGNGQSWRVINMGQNGNVVLNEMLTYLLFGERLRPDIVIAHDGFNDMIYGVSNDSFLLGRHRIAYQDILEQWPQMLYGTGPESSTYARESNYSLRNTPEATVRAYTERKSQFERVVRACGADFIWGQQPSLASKAGRHDMEEDYLEADKPFSSQFGLAYANAERLLDDTADAVDKLAPEHVVNHHRLFRDVGPDEYCFSDYVHCTPEGEARMADTYLKYLIERGMA